MSSEIQTSQKTSNKISKIGITEALNMGVIHLVSSQNSPKIEHFLLPDTHTYVSGGNKCQFVGKFHELTKLINLLKISSFL